MLALTVYCFEVALCACGARALTEVVLRPTPAASNVTIAKILHELEIFILFPRIVKYQFPKKKAYIFLEGYGQVFWTEDSHRGWLPNDIAVDPQIGKSLSQEG